MIAVRRHDRTIVLTGWRARLFGLASVLVAWIVLMLLAALVLGVAITAAVLLVLVLPAALVVAAARSLRNRWRR